MRVATRVSIAFLICLVCGQAHAKGVTVSSAHRFEHSADDITSYLYLPDRMILEASDTVLINGYPIERSKDYWFDYCDGIVYFTRPVPAGHQIRITYVVLPLNLEPEYRLRHFKQTYNSRQLVPLSETKHVSRHEKYQIRASGSKSLRLEAGSLNELHVSQSLDLNLSGSVGSVDVKAVLSDRDMMVGRSGSTSRLKDLDRIFVEVTGKNAYARVGDLEINEAHGDLIQVKREVTGFYFKGSLGSKYLAASGAVARTSSKSVVIVTKEGISGPYVVPGEHGGHALIVRNSESVFLDGRKLRRGETGDYTIDYEKSEIHLNPRIAVRSGSRLLVTYDLEDSEARRLYYLASGMGLGSVGDVSFTYIGETSQVEESAPTLLGTSAMPGWSDGGTFVGAGKGSYIRINGDSCSYYVYVGEGAGDYDVTFTEVGEGKGTYSHVYSETWQKYVYVYTGLGAFIDRIPPLPSGKVDIFHVAAKVKPLGWLEVNSEVAQANGSQTLHEPTRDDAQRAYVISINGTTPMLSAGGRCLGTIGMSGNHRMIGSSFKSFDFRARPDFYEKWGQEAEDGFEVLDEFVLSYDLGEKISTSATLGRLETPMGISVRKAIAGELRTSRFGLTMTSSRVGIERGGSRPDLACDVFELRIPFGLTTLGIGRDYDVRQSEDSILVRRNKYRFGVERSGSVIKASTGILHCLEQRMTDGSWVDHLQDWTASAHFTLRLSKRLNLKAGFLRRMLNYQSSSNQPDQKLSGADLHLDIRDLGLLSNLSVDYNLSHRFTSVYSWELVKLNGVGDYDSLGNYIPGGGTYGMIRKEAGSEAVNFTSMDIDFDLGRRAGPVRDGQISAAMRLRLASESRSDNLMDYAVPFAGPNDDLMSAKADIRQELVYRRRNGFAFRISGRFLSDVDQRCLDRKDSRNRFEIASKLMTTGPLHIGLHLEGRITRAQAISEIGSIRSTSRKHQWMAGLGLQRSIGSHLRGVLDVEISSDRFENPGTSMLVGLLKPGLTLQSQGLRWDNSVRLQRVLKSHDQALGYPRRDSLQLVSRLNLRRGSHITLSFEYSGIKVKGSRPIHNMRSSLTASF